MKKLRPEFVAAMAQTVRFSADGEITLETIKKCCDQGIKRLENAANSNEYENGESILIFVDYDRNGKEGIAYFNARIKEDFFDESTAVQSSDKPLPDSTIQSANEERARLLKLSIKRKSAKLISGVQRLKDSRYLETTRAFEVLDQTRALCNEITEELKMFDDLEGLVKPRFHQA